MSIDLELFYDAEDSESINKNESNNSFCSFTHTSSLHIADSPNLHKQNSLNLHKQNSNLNSYSLTAPFTEIPSGKESSHKFAKESRNLPSGDNILREQHKSLAEINMEEEYLLLIKRQKEHERIQEDAEINRRLYLVQQLKNMEIKSLNKSQTLDFPVKGNALLDSFNSSYLVPEITKTDNLSEESRKTTLLCESESFINPKSLMDQIPSICDISNRGSHDPSLGKPNKHLKLTPDNPLQERIDFRNRELEELNNSLDKSNNSDKHISIFKNAAKLIKQKSTRIVNLVGKAAQKVVKSDDSIMTDDESISSDQIKYKAKKKHGTTQYFENTKLVQLITGWHTGSIWALEFSRCGMFMASGGQDGIIHVWVAKECSDEMRNNRNNSKKLSPEEFRNRLSLSQASLATDCSSLASSHNFSDYSMTDGQRSLCSLSTANTNDRTTVHSMAFENDPFISFHSHESDILSISWSRTHFMVSSSMDMTVRLFNVFHDNCLCCFRHGDCVPSVAFHPHDERYFVSGSLDGIVRIWNIPDKKVAVWNKLEGDSVKLITATNFCRNGRFVAVGTYNGTCVFYYASQLRYYTQIQIKGSGKNGSPKITGIVQMPHCSNKVLVSCNDSRIRLYDLRDLSLTCKYKGACNLNSQIKASFNHSGKYIMSGSENNRVYIWRTNRNDSSTNFSRRDKNQYYESIRAHSVTVSCALFAPRLEYFSKNIHKCGEVFVTADLSGNIKVFRVRWPRQ